MNSGLAASTPTYRQALPGYHFRFPRDHAAHPEYRTEWWYYTGHLTDGRRHFGYELTFFQVGIDPALRKSRSRWAMHTLYFAHLTLTDEDRKRFHFEEQAGRPALGLAGSDPRRYHVWIRDWSARLLPDGRTMRLEGNAPAFGVSLDLTSDKPPAINGSNGVSQKSAGLGHASHYYSMTRLNTRGTVRVGSETLRVTGLSWMDHEFGSNQLGPKQAGWDWFSIQLEDGRELMLYVMRLKNGGVDPVSSGTLVESDGTTRHLVLADFRIVKQGTWRSPHTKAVYPAGWEISVPLEKLNLRLTPTVADQELATKQIGVTYWEGSVRISGEDRGKPVRGEGYVELTGYEGQAPGI